VWQCIKVLHSLETGATLPVRFPLCFTFHHLTHHANTATDAAVDLVIWTSIEANSVIISACIPMLMPLVELIFGENFLSGGSKPRLRTIQTHSELENNSGIVELGMKTRAREREDWQEQFQGGGMFCEESAHGSERSGKSEVSVMYVGVRSSVLDQGGSPSSSSLAYAAAVGAA
jgi:hypothetical protein